MNGKSLRSGGVVYITSAQVRRLARKKFEPLPEWANVSFGIDPVEHHLCCVLLSLREQGLLIDALSRAALAGDVQEVLSWPFVTNIRKGHVPNPNRRPTIPPLLRKAVLERDGGRCRQCSTDDDLQLDHIVAWIFGGTTTLDNLQVLCGPCNRKKGPTAYVTRRGAA